MTEDASMHGRIERVAGKLFVLASLYCILYSPVVAVTKTGVARPLVLIGVLGMLLAAARTQKMDIRIPATAFVAGAGLVIALAIGQSLAMLHGGDTYLLSLLGSVITGALPLAYLTVWAVPSDRPIIPYLASTTASLGALQALLVVADWGSPGVRAVFASIVVQPESLDTGFRAAGLTSITGDGLSVSQAICAVCALHLAVAAERTRTAIAWGVVVAVILAAMVFVGRTGFVLILVYTAYLFVFGRRRGRIVAGALTVIAMFLLGVWLISINIEDERLEGLFTRAVSSAFEAFIGARQGEGLRTVSTDDLWSMVVMPDTLTTWIMGDGFYSNPANPDTNYMGTDIGYLRLLLYVGVIGSLAIYCWYLAVGWWSLQTLRRQQDRILFGGLIFCFFVSQVKFNFLLLSAPLGFALLMFFSAVRERDSCE